MLLICNGYDPVLRWDGQTAMAEPAGLAAPTTAVTLTGSGVGAVVGTYFAYLRYVDRLGNVSNLSPISASLAAQNLGSVGNITNATFAAPIAITSTAHGLSTGNIVKVSGVGGNTSANGVWTVTVVDANTFTLNGSSGNATYTGSGTWVSGIATITFNNVPVPFDPKVKRRQILRNTDGQANEFFVDVDTTDLTSTTLTTTKNDTTLATGTSQTILDSNGLPLANIHGVPPNWKTSLSAHLDRVFACGQYTETRGACIVTTGSTQVTGVGTDWVSGLAGRYLYVRGANNNYQIASVDTINQIITLGQPATSLTPQTTSAYVDASDNFALYAIRPAPVERKLVYYTPAGQPESWPPTYALQIQEDDDEPVGSLSRGSFLYIFERRHIYKETFQDDPAVDGGIYLSANRGCISNRAFAVVDNDAYMLDEFGAYLFSGTGDVVPLSEDIQEIFRPKSLYKFHVNWAAYRYFFAVVSRPQETIRWFVCLEGDFLPRHALCFNYRLKRWWLERYPFAVGGGCSGHIDGVPYTFLVGENATVYALWQGTTDVADPTLGTVRGTATSAGLVSITDTTASFCTSGLGSVINAPVVICDGTGKGQVRRVVSATATALTVNQPWTQTLDNTSVYQVGGVVWNWKTTWMRLNTTPDDTESEREAELLFETATAPATMDFRIRYDFGQPEMQKLSITSKQGGGVRADAGKPDRVIDLTKLNGVVLIRLPNHREKFTDGRRYLQMECAGASNSDPVALYELVINGMGNITTVTQQ